MNLDLYKNALYDACSKGELNQVQRIIQDYPEFIHNPLLPIDTAASKGHFDIVVFLVSKGASDNAKEETLISAASHGQLKIVKYLISIGVNVHSRDGIAIQLAAQYGYLEIVEYLYYQGANIHVDNNYALRTACSQGHLSVVKFLVSKGADIHVWNNSPLLYAIHSNQIDIVRYLVHSGCMVDKPLYTGCISISLWMYIKSLNDEFLTEMCFLNKKIASFYTFTCSFHNNSTFERAKDIKSDPLFDPNLSLIVASYCW